jgi:hypothetical protein
MAMLAAVPGPGMGRPIAKVLEKLPQRGRRDHLELGKPKGKKSRTSSKNRKGAR